MGEFDVQGPAGEPAERSAADPAGQEALPTVPGYRLLRRIGRGGFAVVYEAVQLSLDRLVAVKVLMLDLGSPGDRRRFDRERQSLTRLGDHPHVVDVLDAGVAPDGRPFIVMKLYRRGSLDQVLATSGPLPAAEVVRLIGQVALALDHAHAHGVLHRDVAPKNVLVGDEGQAVLADFGIAGLAAPQEGASTTFLTAAHAAPEVLLDERHSVASDIYSLASTAYALLAGHAPWGNARLKALMASPYAPAPTLPRPDVPIGVHRGLAVGMAPLPQHRPATAAEFARLLAAGLGGGLGPGRSRAGGIAPGATPTGTGTGVQRDGVQHGAVALPPSDVGQAAATVLRPSRPGRPGRPGSPGRAVPTRPEAPFIPGPPLDDAGVAAHIRAEAARAAAGAEGAEGPDGTDGTHGADGTDGDRGLTRDTAGLPSPAPWRAWGVGRGAAATGAAAQGAGGTTGRDEGRAGDHTQERTGEPRHGRTGRRWWGRG